MKKDNKVKYNRRQTDRENAKKGLSLRALNYIMSAVTFVISALMLVSVYLTTKGYAEMKECTEDYIVWEQSAEMLKNGSDYLTEQVRTFTVTGEKEHMDSYFNEANVTRRRDKALEVIKSNLKGSQAYVYIQHAMKESLELMDREYYAMRLTADAFGISESELPEEIKSIKLKDEDIAKSNEEKSALARSYVFDKEYRDYKESIYGDIQKCVGDLAESTRVQMSESFISFNKFMTMQKILIAALVAIVVTIIVLTAVQIVKPLARAIPNIEGEKPLPEQGAYEYRYLAKTYNNMYKINKQQKSRLKYEATHDILTGMLNRSGYESICSSPELENYALMIIDVDNFKSVNDTHGHATGDAVLIMAANELKKNFRSSDYICRVGGDEFAVVINRFNDNAENRNALINKMKTINEVTQSGHEGLPVVTISTGVAFGVNCEDSVETAKNADKALYTVKQGVKGTVAFYQAE